jgi:hypothetical protein
MRYFQGPKGFWGACQMHRGLQSEGQGQVCGSLSQQDYCQTPDHSCHTSKEVGLSQKGVGYPRVVLSDTVGGRTVGMAWELVMRSCEVGTGKDEGGRKPASTGAKRVECLVNLFQDFGRGALRVG